jgi:hypothetical protein
MLAILKPDKKNQAPGGTARRQCDAQKSRTMVGVYKHLDFVDYDGTWMYLS